MKQDPFRGGGSTLSPAYSAALERLAKKRLIGDAPLDELPQIGNAPPGKRSVIGGTGKGGLGIVGDALNMAKGIVLSPVATVADIAWKPFEAIPGAPDFNPEDAGTVNLFVQGGKSLQHVYGDAKELGRSIITGKDTLSQSPSAKTYQAAGGGLEGALMAAAPYLDVGSVVAPMALGAARGAGLVAPKPVPYTPLTASQVDATRPMTPYRTTRNALAEDMAQAMTADELRNFAEKVAGSTQQVANLDNGLYGVWGDDPLINDRLRGDYLGTDVDEQIKLAQEFFTRVPPLQRPVKAFRGIMVERPEAGTNAFSDFVRTWEVGDVIEEPGFMSTTIDRNIAEGYANGGRVIEIDIPKGTQVATPEMFGPALRSTEQELTLPPGTKLQITSIADDVIKAKVVPSDTPITKMQTTRDALLRYVDPEVTAPQTGRTMNPVEELAAAQAQQNVVPLFPEQPPSPGRLRVTNAKLGQSEVTDLASYREARNPRLRRFNPNAGDDLYPQGTTFVGKPGAPGRNEAMRKLPSFSTVYEFKFDPEDGLTEYDFFKEGIAVEDYDLFGGLLLRAKDYKLPRAEQFKVALTNFAQRMGADAIVVNDELILVPRGKLFKDYFAEDEFGLSAIDITPTNRRTMNPD